MKLKETTDSRTCEAEGCESPWQVKLGNDSVLGRAHGADLRMCLKCASAGQKIVAGSSASDHGGRGRGGSYVAMTPGQAKFAKRGKKADAFDEDED